MSKEIRFFKNSKDMMIALLIPSDYSNSGISFITDNECFQQIAHMGHSAGHKILPHYHNRIERTVDYTCETLVMRKGTLQVDLYDEKEIIYTFTISEGDVLSLFGGGHGFKAISDVDMIEIKQGPYIGESDKTRF